MFLSFLFSFVAFAEETCTLDSVTFPSLNEDQSAVLQKYGATCTKTDSAQDEKAAAALYREVQNALKNDDITTAKAKIHELMEKYGHTRLARRAQRTQKEINIIGNTVSQDLGTVEWFQGTASLKDAKLSLVVFWEVWCPHCKREIPNLQTMYDSFKDKELNIIGLTKLSRNKTKEDAMSFILEKGVSYPIGKEDGALSKEFAVSGIPAAALVKDGVIIWRGHPAQLSSEKIEQYLQ